MEDVFSMKKSLLLVLAVIVLLLSACQAAATPAAQETPVDAQPEPEGYPAPSDPLPADAYPAPGQDPGEAMFSAYPPAPDDRNLERGNFFVDAVTLQPVADTPGTVEVYVEGSLPTPCNEPRVEVYPPDASNRIVVELYSVIDPEMMCIQVIEPFTGQIATLSGYPSGTYSVVVDNQTVGELVVP
jgi:hypothetical protein